MEEQWQNASVEVAELPKLESARYQLHPVRFKRFRYLSLLLFIGPLIIVLSIVAIFAGVNWPLSVILVLSIVLFLNIAGIQLDFPKRGYALRDQDITYAEGWLFHSVITIPFNRIQHSEVSEGPLERRFKLSTLKIYTAGGSSSDLSIPGLEKEEAQLLRDYISKKAAQHA